MKKILSAILILIIIGFITIQFFQPEKNQAPVTTEDIFFQLDVPDAVKNNLVASCYDCHSNQTKYPWYGRVAPMSWMIGDHVKHGKEELNFSDWASYSKRKKIGLLGDICDVIEDGSMPLESYLKLHSDAVLGEADIEAICNWAENAAETVMEN